MDADEAFGDYLETFEADEMFNRYLSDIRKAFIAGYKATGGEVPQIQPVLRLIRNAEKDK